MSDGTVASTIAAQMGGYGRLTMMTGANNFTYDDNSLRFKFKGSRKTNFIKVTLNGKDLYDVEFGKIRGLDYKVVETFDDAYADMLIPVFEDLTGLYLHF